MKRLLSAALALSLFCGSVSAQTPTPEPAPTPAPEAVASAIRSLVAREFYRPVTFPALPEKMTDADIDRALASFGTSHTARFKPGTVDYFELADILHYPIRNELKRMFPPDGEPAYEGIGIATRKIDGRIFVSDIYDATPAARSGLLAGDELLRVDDEPFREIASFKGKAGREATLSVRRKAKDKPLDIKLRVTRIRPVKAFSDAIAASMRVTGQDGLKIGYLHLWALGSGDIEEMITNAVKDGALKDADGLVVDLRGRWGGMFGQVPDMLISESAEVSFKDRSGKVSYASTTYRKPVVAIVDEGTRSAQEMFAALMRKRGAEIVGKQTAGAVLATRAFVLPDDSLLVLPISEVRIDGETLEGKGVTPDVAVDFWLPYAAGKDPQLETAMERMTAKLCADPANEAAACKRLEPRSN